MSKLIDMACYIKEEIEYRKMCSQAFKKCTYGDKNRHRPCLVSTDNFGCSCINQLPEYIPAPKHQSFPAILGRFDAPMEFQTKIYKRCTTPKHPFAKKYSRES